jgi:hypothetical protein
MVRKIVSVGCVSSRQPQHIAMDVARIFDPLARMPADDAVVRRKIYDN